MILRSKLLIASISIVTLILVSLFVSPFLNSSFFSSHKETFSELWLLGPERTAENYPFNITSNEYYQIYVGVSNQLGVPESYIIRVKFCNNPQQLPNSTTTEPSSLESICDFQFTLLNEEVWENPLSFAITFDLLQNITRAESITINNEIFPVNYVTSWDSTKNGFYNTLLFELWSYDDTMNDFQYTNQNVRLCLNMTGF